MSKGSGKPKTTLPGKVEKVIKPLDPRESEKAQIDIEGADELYREIRIENKLTDEQGKDVQLKEGEDVDVTVEGDPDATRKSKKKGARKS